MGYIYKITNDINNMIYIGQTSRSVDYRWKEHLTDVKTESTTMPIHLAMRKYGIEHFCVELVEQCESSLLNEREIYWINYYDSFHNGYNATIGGNVPRLYSPEEIKSLWDDGLNLEEIAEKLGASVSTVSCVLRSYDDYLPESRKRYQKYVDEELSNPVVQYDLDGNVIKQYKSLNEACREINLPLSQVGNSCKYHWKTSGYQFRWVGDTPATKVKATPGKIVGQYDLDWNLLGKYDSAVEASKKTNVPDYCIRQCCRKGKTGTSYGYHWLYLNMED